MKKETIGIFTASTPGGYFYPKRLAKAISFLESKGHQIIKGNLINKADVYRSGNINQRLNEINILLDENIDILLASIGGWNSSSLLSLLPYSKINERKIVICGFSDTTAILNAIIKKCPNARAIYSPSLIPNFGENEQISQNVSYDFWLKIIRKENTTLRSLDFTYESSENWNLFEETDFIQSPIVKQSNWKVINANSIDVVEGVLFGGNGNTLSGLLGTDYVPDFPDNGILFLEDAEKNACEVERIFAIFLNHGIFKKAKAVILGKHDKYRDSKQPWEILEEILTTNALQVPIIYDVDVSHTRPMLSLELNRPIIVNFKEKTIFQKFN